MGVLRMKVFFVQDASKHRLPILAKDKQEILLTKVNIKEERKREKMKYKHAFSITFSIF